jgi:hypothetical protein
MRRERPIRKKPPFDQLTNKRKSAQIIREIEWNRRSVSWGLDAGEHISYPILFVVFIFIYNFKG